MRMFSVAVTDASSSSSFVPERPRAVALTERIRLPAFTFAPSAAKPSRCVSSLRCPMPSPPGGGRDTPPARARRGPAKRNDVRIFRARPGSRRAVRSFAAVMVTVRAARSHSTFAPNAWAQASMLRTSAMSGMFVRTTGSDVRSAAATIGNAAFLLPGTRCVPDTALRPLIEKVPIVGRMAQVYHRRLLPSTVDIGSGLLYHVRTFHLKELK